MEMERDSLISHGGAAMLRDRLCDASDAFKTIVCQVCGTIAISNVASKELICRNCEGKGDFGEVTIPYAFKLLIHLLWAAGINMTLRTRKVG
jgi:DNA-directed RNA polymerase II subunit RPB2